MHLTVGGVFWPYGNSTRILMANVMEIEAEHTSLEREAPELFERACLPKDDPVPPTGT
jgi:hypothetical protein